MLEAKRLLCPSSAGVLEVRICSEHSQTCRELHASRTPSLCLIYKTNLDNRMGEPAPDGRPANQKQPVASNACVSLNFTWNQNPFLRVKQLCTPSAALKTAGGSSIDKKVCSSVVPFFAFIALSASRLLCYTLGPEMLACSPQPWLVSAHAIAAAA